MASEPMSQSESLKPCPFCGGEPERLELTDEDNFGGGVISCKKCGASSPVHFDRKENLDDSWNRRTSTADRGGEVEPSEAEVEAAIVAEADAINKTHGDPGHAVQWPDDFTPDEQHCRREGMRAALTAAARIRSALATTAGEAGQHHHKLDNDTQVFFYEQDFYVLSNFSAFTLLWEGEPFYTSEAAYHWEKFRSTDIATANNVRFARSAHEAFKLAEHNKHLRRSDWDDVKVDIMRDILRAKADQHEYVRRKLLATGDRELVEDSWRDDFWGWGPNRDGKNMLGKLWMEVRAELRAALLTDKG